MFVSNNFTANSGKKYRLILRSVLPTTVTEDIEAVSEYYATHKQELEEILDERTPESVEV